MSQPRTLLPAPVGKDVVGRPKPKILPEFVCQRRGALQEEGLPVVAGIEDVLRLPDRLVRGVLTRAGNELDLGAIGAHLNGHRCRGVRRGEDLRAHAGGGRLRGDG